MIYENRIKVFRVANMFFCSPLDAVIVLFFLVADEQIVHEINDQNWRKGPGSMFQDIKS